MFVPYSYIIMNYIIANSLCCCLQCCCKQIFQALYKLIGKMAFVKLMHNLIYFSFFFMTLGAFLFLRKWPFFMKYLVTGIQCIQNGEFDCLSASVIYRISASIVLVIILILVSMLSCSYRVSKIVNQGLFFSKFVLITVLFVIFLQLDNNIFQLLGKIFQYVSYIFLICQTIIIIDLSYLWGIKWAQKYSQGQKKYGIYLIVFTILLFATTLGLNIYGYILAQNQNQAQSSIEIQNQCKTFPNILSTIFVVLSVGIQLFNFNKQNSLLTTGCISFFMSFWFFTSLYSQYSCNLTLKVIRSETIIQFTKSDFYIIGTGLTVLIMILSAFGSIFGSTNQIKEQDEIQFIQLQQASKNQSNKFSSKTTINESKQKIQNSKWIKWHIFMLTMIIYLSMILTDWGSGNIIDGKFSINQNAFISKVFMGCFTFICYTWTLIAPRIMPNRNFYFS